MARRNSTLTVHAGTLIEVVKRKFPAVITLVVGVFVGLVFAGALNRDTHSGQQWYGAGALDLQAPYEYRAGERHSSYIPTLDQRFRVFEVLSTLTGHHTQQCTANSQPEYRRQAYERYERLIGYRHYHPQLSLFGRLLSFIRNGHNADEKTVVRETPFKRAHQQRTLKERSLTEHQHKYFFAITLHNSFDIIPDLFSTLLRVCSILGYHNVLISVYENGSTDQTKSLLKLFEIISQAVGLRMVIRTSPRTRGAFHHQIEYMAEIRNLALAPLHELRDVNGEVFDTVIFMEDNLPCIDDLLELIWQSRMQNAGITCGMDYVYLDGTDTAVFVGNWISRDINGTALENGPFASVFGNPESSQRFQRHSPIQVQSCWNGLAILDPAPLYAHPHVRFRMAKTGSAECSASDCSLLNNDYWKAGYGRVLMVPRVRLAYDKQVFDITHPSRTSSSAKTASTSDKAENDPQDQQWFAPHDRLFSKEESEPIAFKPAPSHVWCWGFSGAGNIDGPDAEPVWEPLNISAKDPTAVRHDRGFEL